jgi:hypothetical protein
VKIPVHQFYMLPHLSYQSAIPDDTNPPSDWNMLLCTLGPYYPTASKPHTSSPPHPILPSCPLF